MYNQKNILDHSQIHVREGNVHIGDIMITKDDQYFYQKLLNELDIYPYLVNRKEQDHSVYTKIQLVKKDSKPILGILHGELDESPDKYRHRLEYYLNDWLEEFQPATIDPQIFKINWPVNYHSQEQLKTDLFRDLRMYHQVTDEHSLEKLYQRFPEQHLVFYDVFSIATQNFMTSEQNKSEFFDKNKLEKIIKGFFEFWSNIPPRASSYKVIAILVFKYPTEKKKKWFLFKKPDQRLKNMLWFLERCHQISHQEGKACKEILDELKIQNVHNAECFVFPTVKNIHLKDIDDWLGLNVISKKMGRLDLSQQFQRRFSELQTDRISLKAFKDYLVEFIKTN